MTLLGLIFSLASLRLSVSSTHNFQRSNCPMRFLTDGDEQVDPIDVSAIPIDVSCSQRRVSVLQLQNEEGYDDVKGQKSPKLHFIMGRGCNKRVAGSL